MNSLTIILSLCLISMAAAHGKASSWASRSDIHGHATKVEVSHGDGHGHGGHDEGKGGHHYDYFHHPAYKFEYGVEDPKSKDSHSAWEHRDGDKVTGEYSLNDADGTKRIVKYSSDKKSGFTAHVEQIGHANHPAGGHHSHGHHWELLWIFFLLEFS